LLCVLHQPVIFNFISKHLQYCTLVWTIIMYFHYLYIYT